MSCITATHDKEDVLPFADKVLIIKEGKQKSFDTPKETYNRPKDIYTASLFSEINEFSEQFLGISSSRKKRILYPNQIQISVSGKFEAIVKNCLEKK